MNLWFKGVALLSMVNSSLQFTFYSIDHAPYELFLGIMSGFLSFAVLIDN